MPAVSCDPPSNHRMPLIGLLWPAGLSPLSSATRTVLLIGLGTGLLALSAKVSVPLPYVPMSMQSLAVLLIGAAYGSRLGVATVLAYLGEGAMGLPVFTGPVGGISYMSGSTGGYLAAFVPASFVVGWLSEHGWGRPIPRLFAAMCVGHVVILAFGFAWLVLGIKIGVERAWLLGVLPFIAGSIIKSALGAVFLLVLRRQIDRIHE